MSDSSSSSDDDRPIVARRRQTRSSSQYKFILKSSTYTFDRRQYKRKKRKLSDHEYRNDNKNNNNKQNSNNDNNGDSFMGLNENALFEQQQKQQRIKQMQIQQQQQKLERQRQREREIERQRQQQQQQINMNNLHQRQQIQMQYIQQNNNDINNLNYIDNQNNNKNNKKTMELDQVSGLKRKINAIDGGINDLIRKYHQQISEIKSLSDLREMVMKTQNTFKKELRESHAEKLRIYDEIKSNNKTQIESEQKQYKSQHARINLIEVEDKEIDQKIKRYEEMIEELKSKKERNKILKMKKKEILNERALRLNKVKKTYNETDEMIEKIKRNMDSETNMMGALNKNIMNYLKKYEANYHEWSTKDVIEWIKCIENGKYNDIAYARTIKQIEMIKICGNKLSDLRNETILKLIGLSASDQISFIKNVDRVINENKLTEQKQDMCTICASKRINSVFIPCGHQFCCFGCYEKCKQKYQNCPICRKKVTNTIKTFMNGFS